MFDCLKVGYWGKTGHRPCRVRQRLKIGAYEPGSLVLLRNNQIENSVSIERKTADRYMGPYRIVRQTTGGSYVLAEMDGSLLRHYVAAYRLIPYVQRQDLDTMPEEGTKDNSRKEDEEILLDPKL